MYPQGAEDDQPSNSDTALVESSEQVRLCIFMLFKLKAFIREVHCAALMCCGRAAGQTSLPETRVWLSLFKVLRIFSFKTPAIIFSFLQVVFPTSELIIRPKELIVVLIMFSMLIISIARYNYQVITTIKSSQLSSHHNYQVIPTIKSIICIYRFFKHWKKNYYDNAGHVPNFYSKQVSLDCSPPIIR